MEKFIEKYEKELNETLDWIIDVVAEAPDGYYAIDDKILYEGQISCEVNDYVLSTYEELSEDVQDQIIELVVDEYFKLDNGELPRF